MKKTLVLAGLLVSAVLFAGTIGYIDTQEISTKYSKISKIQEKLLAKKNEFEKQLMDEKKKIDQKEDAIAKAGTKAADKDRKDLDALKKSFNDKAQNLQIMLQNLQADELDKTKKEVEKACMEVSKKKKLECVVDKAAILYGGVDVTKDVMAVLEKKSK